MSYLGIRYCIPKLPLALALALAVSMPAAAQDKGKIIGATPLQPGTTYKVGTTGSGTGAQAQSRADKRVSVIVKLRDDSLAAYKGGVTGLAPTSPAATGARSLDVGSTASRQYLSYLQQRQGAFAAAATGAIAGAEVRQRFDIVLGGVSMLVPATQVDAIRALPGVEAVYIDELLHLDTNVSPQFIGAPAIWQDLGGQDDAGEGVIVGVLDSGIWPEHPSLSDPDPAGNAYPAPPPSGGPRDCEFGNIAANPADAPFNCNNKLIVADTFIDTYKAVIGLLPEEFDSARDDNGHGTHTATTAAGNAGVDAEIFGVERGTISGIAPRAHVAAYRVCGDQGCFSSDSVAAVQRAILDGVDVINFSISGGGNPYADAVELAFLDAYAAGVFVAASAGNSGPAADTVDHRGPWVTTIAASNTDRFFLSTLSLAAGGDTLELVGASITDGVPVPTPVVLANDFDPADNNLCLSPFSPGSLADKIVVCQVGTNTRNEKGFNVLQGGAVGMILYNAALQGIASDNQWLPTVMIEVDKGQALLTFLSSHPGATATFTDGEAETVKGDVMAAFSSRGGPGQTLGISKPDVTAPGVQILAGHTPLPATVAGGPQEELFQAIRGTSMSSPHAAGAGALLADLHPDWTPGQIKSALMTTAKFLVFKEDETTLAGPFDMGSGRIDLRHAGDAGITFDVSAAQYVALEDELWNANYPSIYLSALPGQITLERLAHSVVNKNQTYHLSVKAPKDLTVAVPKTLKVPKLGDAAFDITIDGRNVPLGEVRHATISMKGGTAGDLRIPISIVRRQPAVTLAKSCVPLVFKKGNTTTCTITATNAAFDAAEVTLTDELPNGLELVPGSVVGATPSNHGLEFSGTLAPVEPPNVVTAPGASPFGYVPLAAEGVAPIGGVDDETITNFNVPAFVFAGETWNRIGLVSNGYIVVGGGTGGDIDFVNQDLPDPAPPNNVLAPFWTDLNPGVGGAMRIAIYSDGADDWIVMEWDNVPNFSNSSQRNSFQVWIGINGVEDISYVFGPAVSAGDLGFVTVGAENRFGNRGNEVFLDGAGTPPAPGTELRVTSTAGAPGETKVITFQATGVKPRKFQNCAELTSQLFQGINLACVNGQVKLQ